MPRTQDRKLPTLWVFIEQCMAHGVTMPWGRNNSWVTCLGFAEMYVRFTKRWVNGETLSPVLDLANMTAREPGKGAFTRLFNQLRERHPHMHIFVEQTHERFGAYLEKLGFTKLDPTIHGNSYIFKAR